MCLLLSLLYGGPGSSCWDSKLFFYFDRALYGVRVVILPLLSFRFSPPNSTMQSMEESFALVREAPDLDELVVDDAWAAETDPGDSGEVEQNSEQLSIDAFARKN